MVQRLTNTGPPTSNLTISDCDLCFLKQSHLQADSPFDGGDDAVSEYSSFTSSCQVTDMPLTTTTLSSSTSTAAVPTTTCAGTNYNVSPGDTCQSIAQSQGISVGWLIAGECLVASPRKHFLNDLIDNPSQLSAYCTNITATSEPLCIQNKCKTYTVRQNDT